MAEPDPPRSFSLPRLPWMQLYLALILLLYVLAYQSSVFPPGQTNPLGRWGWWEQSQYLKSADALAGGRLVPSEHWYPRGYPLLGAAFFNWVPLHPYFIPNAICLLAFGAWMVSMARWLDVPPAWGAAAFLVGTAFSPLLLEQYVIPFYGTDIGVFERFPPAIAGSADCISGRNA